MGAGLQDARSLPERIRARALLRLHRRGALRSARERDRQRTDSHAQKPDAPLERNALQAESRGVPDRLRILRRLVDRLVARHRLEIVVAQLDADRAAGVALPLEIVAHFLAKHRE